MMSKGHVTLGEDPEHDGDFCYWVIEPREETYTKSLKIQVRYYAVPIEIMRKLVSLRKIDGKLCGTYGTDPEKIILRNVPTRPNLLTFCRFAFKVGIFKKYTGEIGNPNRKYSAIHNLESFIWHRFLRRD